MSFRFLIILLVVLLTVGTGSVSTRAREDATPGATTSTVQVSYAIYPKGKGLGDYFQPTIDAGKSKKLTVVLANTGSTEAKLRTYAVNVRSAVNGGFEAAPAGTPPEGPTTWLDYSEEIYTIEPGKGIERTFTIRVPKGTEPGQYITAIALENAEAGAVEGSDVFKQVVRFPMPVFITVPGPVKPSLAIGHVTAAANGNFTQFQIEVLNTGNVRLRPAGTVEVRDASGNLLFTVPVTMGSVYAHDTTILQTGVPALGGGSYHVTVKLTDPETQATAESETTVTTTGAATPVAAPPVQVTNASATPQPSAEKIQFLDVKATIANSGEPLTNVQVVLHAERDGKVVEDFPLAASLAVPNGETPVQARYLPATGWKSGTWHFTLSVEAVGGNGVAQVLATADLGTIQVP
jgi:hypothetical protein